MQGDLVGTESESEAGALKVYLVDRDVSCPGCGYNLRGLPEPVCPECRQELRISVGLSESRMAELVTCAAFLFAGTGAGAAVLITVAVLVATHGGGPNGREAVVFIWLPLGCFVSCGIAAASLARAHGRQWFRGLSTGARASVILGSIALPIAWLAVELVQLVDNW